MSKKLLIMTMLAFGLAISWMFWSNNQVEAKRQKMRGISRGMSHADVAKLVSEPDKIHFKSSKGILYTTFYYENPEGVVNFYHDSATSAYFYNGKLETLIFE
jgi:hypothetical protein